MGANLDVARKMREPAHRVANVISLSAAISACNAADRWEQALTLLHKMRESSLAANVVSLSAAISACDKEGQ